MFYNSSRDRYIFIDTPLSTVNIVQGEVFAMLHFLPKDIKEIVFNVKAFTSGVIIKHAEDIETLNLVSGQTLDNLKIMCFTPGIFASFLNKYFGFEFINGYDEYSAHAILITSYTDLYQHAITNTNRIFRKKDLVNFDLQI